MPSDPFLIASGTFLITTEDLCKISICTIVFRCAEFVSAFNKMIDHLISSNRAMGIPKNTHASPVHTFDWVSRKYVYNVKEVTKVLSD